MKKNLLLVLSILLGSFGMYAQNCGNIGNNPDFEGGTNPSGQPNWYFGFENTIAIATDQTPPDGSNTVGHAPDGGAMAVDNYSVPGFIVPGNTYQFCADMLVGSGTGFSQIKMQFKSGGVDIADPEGSCSMGVAADGTWQQSVCTTCVAPPGTDNILVYAQTGNGREFWVDNICVTDLTVNPLPIELAAIDAYAKDQMNIIEWSTKSEDNVELFEIQKSVNKANDWNSITRINAVGFSTTEQFYKVEDKAPSSLNYYRIISHDFDGKTEITPIVAVKRQQVIEPISLFPSPAFSTLNVKVSLKEATNYSIFDIHGKVLAGGVFSADQDSYILEINDLISGIYLLKINENVVRFFKQ